MHWPKAVGMSYIRYAQEQQHLFRITFLSEGSMEKKIEREVVDDFYIRLVQETLGLNYKEAKMFHLQMWLFVHGIASTIVTSFYEWDVDFLGEMVTNVFLGLKFLYCSEDNGKLETSNIEE